MVFRVHITRSDVALRGPHPATLGGPSSLYPFPHAIPSPHTPHPSPDLRDRTRVVAPIPKPGSSNRMSSPSSPRRRSQNAPCRKARRTTVTSVHIPRRADYLPSQQPSLRSKQPSMLTHRVLSSFHLSQSRDQHNFNADPAWRQPRLRSNLLRKLLLAAFGDADQFSKASRRRCG